MSFGFECGDGWFHILDDLFSILSKKDVVLCQVKEKFGGLRVYTGSAPDCVYDLISLAEMEAFRTCELCGNIGFLHHKGSWLKTLCNNCATTHHNGYRKVIET